MPAFAALASALAILLAGAADAAELVMFETATCPWCLKWHREVGAVYPLSDEGRRLTLRRVAQDGPRPADLVFIGEIRFVPTFVAIHCGNEVGRIHGYLSDEQFWGELSAIMRRLDRPCPKL